MAQIVLATGADTGGSELWDLGVPGARSARPFQRLIDLSPQGVLVQSWRGEWLGGRYERLAAEPPLVDGATLRVAVPVELLRDPDQPDAGGVGDAWGFQVWLSGHRAAADLGEGVGGSRAWHADGRESGPDEPRIYDLLTGHGAGEGALDQRRLLRTAATTGELELPIVGVR
jgi:hypothetical protein